MITTPKTAAEVLEEIRRATAKPVPRKNPRKPAAPELPRSMRTVNETRAWYEDGWTCVLVPMEAKSQRWQAAWKDIKDRSANKQIVLTSLCTMLSGFSMSPGLRATCTALEIVRLSPRHLDEGDNDGQSVKAVRDWTCGWLELGHKVLSYNGKYGLFDGRLLRSKAKPGNPIVYTVDQDKWAENPRLFGVVIKFKFAIPESSP